MYIVSSGGGYFIRFENGSPLMDTDPVCASRLKGRQAEEVIRQLEKMGFVGELIEIIFGKAPLATSWL